MSVNLPAVDLSTAVVGSSNTLSWVGKVQGGQPGIGVRAGAAHLRLFNESGCGVDIQFDTGRSDRIPAGGWSTYTLSGEQSLVWTVTYVLPGAPVALLLAVLYEPSESVPALPSLGNSPIGIGGTVATSTTNQVINDGNAAPVAVVEATPQGAASSQLLWNNDGSGKFGGGLVAVSSAGVFTAIPANAIPASAIASGYPAANIGAGTLASGVHLSAISSDGGALYSNGAGALIGALFQATGGISSFAPASGAYDALELKNSHDATYAGLAGYADPTYGAGAGLYIWDAKNGGYILSAATKSGITFGGKVVSDGGLFATDGTGNLAARRITPAYGGSLAGVNFISGSGSATVNHGLSNTPNAAVVNTNNGSNSTTFGSGTYGPTTVFIYQFNAQAWVGLVYIK